MGIVRRFFIEASNLTGTSGVISDPDARHIIQVLRLKAGDEVELFDGKGQVYAARIVALLSKQVNVALIKKIFSKPESPVQIAVAQAFLKERKMDTLIRQLTELGVTTWIPFISERSLPRPDKKRLSVRSERWERIARESLKQCRRSQIPEIGTVSSFKEVIDIGKAFEIKIIFWEHEDRPISSLIAPKTANKRANKIFLMLGPEGGFSAREIEQAQASGFDSISLGPRILKAETATLTACTLIQYLFGDLGQKQLDKDTGF